MVILPVIGYVTSALFCPFCHQIREQKCHSDYSLGKEKLKRE